MASPAPVVYKSFIDVTPERTLSTIQFDSEMLNTIVSSILVVLIVVNFNSMVHKLVSLTHRNYFNYASYLRSYIFSSSDDVSRIFSWIRGGNSYLPEHWPQRKKKLVLGRLFYPLLARTAIFVLSIGSIALTVPGTRRFTGCGGGDFTPRIVISTEAEGDRVTNSVCSSIDVITTRGETNTTLDLCSYPLLDDNLMAEFSELGNYVLVSYYDTTGKATIQYAKRNDGGFFVRAFEFYLEWTKYNDSKFRSKFDPSQFNSEIHFRLALQALNLDDSDRCGFTSDPKERANPGGNSYDLSRVVDCEINVITAQTDAEYIVREGLQWVKMDKIQPRVRVLPGDDAEDYSDISECPYVVSVSRPIVNLVPLTVALVMIFTFNLAVGLTVANHGDIGEVSYHIMKEALGLDITCNPLQETDSNERGVGGSQLPLIEFREFNCPDGRSAHGGFFVGEGDVDGHIEFKRRIVGSCSCDKKSINLHAAAE